MPPVRAGVAILLACTSVGVWAWHTRSSLWLLLMTMAVCVTGGWLLAADAWSEAWRPPLRTWFEDVVRATGGTGRDQVGGQAGGQAREGADGSGEQAQEAAEATVLVSMTGTLRADATVRATGVLLSVDVHEIERLDVSSSGIRSGPPSRGSNRPGERGHRRLARDRHGTAVRGGVLLTVAGELGLKQASQWRRGRRIRAPAQVRLPTTYQNPGAGDEAQDLARRGSVLVGSVKSAVLVEFVARDDMVGEWAGEARRLIRDAVRRTVGVWSDVSQGIVTAILIGDRAGVDAGVERRLQDAGTYHVIAISGGNIAILAGLLLTLVRAIGCLGPLTRVMVALSLSAYGVVVSPSASVQRAVLTAVLYLAAASLDLKGPSINLLAVVAFVSVLWEPLAVVDPGFLLTFGASAGILLSVPAGSTTPQADAPLRRLGRSLFSLFRATAAAEALLLPVGALVFQRVTLAGLVLNFVAIPMMALAQVAGLVATALALAGSPFAPWIGWLAHLGAQGVVRSGDGVEYLSALVWRVAPPHGAVVSLYYAGLAAAWLTWRYAESGGRPPPLLLPASLALAAATSSWVIVEPWAWWSRPGRLGDGRLHLLFADVGQGDAAIIRFPHGKTMVVDAGGAGGASTFDVGERVVAPLLRRDGVRQLHALVLTHGDGDHIGGALSLVLEFRPAAIWEGIPVPSSSALKALREAGDRVGARWVSAIDGLTEEIDGVRASIVHPPAPDWERPRVRNDDSIVMELRWRQVGVLMTGDVSREVEEDLVERFARAGGSAAVRLLKVAHHGSLSSSSIEFLRGYAPHVAVVSVGRHNPFGHPAPAVVERYRAMGIPLFRTDRHGAVSAVTDGLTIEVLPTVRGIPIDPHLGVSRGGR